MPSCPILVVFPVARAATVTIDLSTTNAFDLSIVGAQPDDMAGAAIAVGDLNGDRIDDLVVGIPGSDTLGGQRLDGGEVRVFFGKPGSSPDHVRARLFRVMLLGRAEGQTGGTLLLWMR